MNSKQQNLFVRLSLFTLFVDIAVGADGLHRLPFGPVRALGL